MTGDEGPSTWSIESASPLTLERLREGLRLYHEWMVFCPCRACEVARAGENATADHATEELLTLVRQDDYVGFRALALCLMPPDEVDACWEGARRHLRLPPTFPPTPPAPPTPPEATVQVFEDVLMDEINTEDGTVREDPSMRGPGPQFYGPSIVDMLRDDGTVREDPSVRGLTG